MNVREQMAGIDASLDDVQAGAEATSRAAKTLVADTAQFGGLLKRPLRRCVSRHVRELQACARDQRGALRELRSSVTRLRKQLKIAQRVAIRPPPPFGVRLTMTTNSPTETTNPPIATTNPPRVHRCLLCGNTAITAKVDGRFVTTSCQVCYSVFTIEFDPPDEPGLRARIERTELA